MEHQPLYKTNGSQEESNNFYVEIVVDITTQYLNISLVFIF
jgi:hypothetical protein